MRCAGSGRKEYLAKLCIRIPPKEVAIARLPLEGSELTMDLKLCFHSVCGHIYVSSLMCISSINYL